MAYYRPETSLRVAPISDPDRAALLFIDVQNYNCHPDGAIYKSLDTQKKQEASYFYDRVQETCALWSALQLSCRQARVEVLYTVIQSLTKDGRDRGLDYKISGFHVPPGSWDAEMLDCIAPGNDEMVIPKTSSSVFQSTNIDYLLRSMWKRQLVVCGCVTDQCVEHAVRDACDLGYFVTLVTDACVTYSSERHEASLNAVKGYCRQLTTEQFIAEIERTRSRQC